MRKWVVFSVLVVVVAVAFYGLLLATRRSFWVVLFSGDGHILGDGFGLYEEGVQGVYIRVFSDGFAIVLLNSSRSVFVRFQEAYWRDERLNIVASRLPSKNYRVVLSVGGLGFELRRMSVGDVWEAENAMISIGFVDADSGEISGYALRVKPTPQMLGSMSGFSIGEYAFLVNVTGLEPHQALWDEGHVTLMRNGEDEWAVDVDAWLTLFQKADGEVVKHYVRLSFRVTLRVYMKGVV